ncbi:MAG: ATP-dependent zinc metalloprotease FTSH 4, mitochondrial [Piccolia ochrophora]|nr:MAG: ATP-dependent zinc metalloprotease FTSH 4, mitochondrial [Piccolia ochrophora]
MAFQLSAGFQNMASVTSELRPTMSKVLTTPWRTMWSGQRRSMSGFRLARTAEPSRKLATSPSPPTLDLILPERFTTTPKVALLPRISRQIAQGLSKAKEPISMKSLYATTPVLCNASPPFQSIRRLSTYSPFNSQQYRQIPRSTSLSIPKRRTLFGQSSSRNALAHMEQTANNNPQSATAQNAFYQALLRANLSDIVVERYQTGRYATSPACEGAYQRALERLGQTGSAHLAGSQVSGQNNALSGEQLQAIGQAVAAQSRGGNISVARGGKASSAGTGGKESPLYVVVEESIGGTIFKWAKFLLYFCLVTYFALVLLTVAVETTGILKRVGGSQPNEARPEHQTTRFSDVHGCDEAKEELQEIVEFLRAPEKFSTLGGKLPKGVLLVGPPGTGKTLLARAVAGEAGVPFFFMSGSEFDEIYVGVGAKRVRDLFNAARQKAPAIVFIDELDAIGGKRNDRDAAYVKQTLNQLLTDLDGFSQSSGVVFLAATNFPQLLDKALTRPGRFDRNVVVPLPDVRGRVAILQYHMKGIQVGTDVDSQVIARGTPGFSGAELENIVNTAAVRASKQQQNRVSMMDFEWAKDKIMMGAERRSMVIQEKDKLMTAYHEGGHALVAMLTHGADPLYKVTVLPRGQALGVTHQLPEIDKVSMSKRECTARLDVCMGGKIAEGLVYGAEEVTSGASSDIESATAMAYRMVTKMGFSDLLGDVDLDSSYTRLSDTTKRAIEDEVSRLITEAGQRAAALLTKHRKDLDTLAKALVEYETLDAAEVDRILKGKKLDKLGVGALDRKGDLRPDQPGPQRQQRPGGGAGGDEDDGASIGKGVAAALTLPDSLLPPGMKGRSGGGGGGGGEGAAEEQGERDGGRKKRRKGGQKAANEEGEGDGGAKL